LAVAAASRAAQGAVAVWQAICVWHCTAVLNAVKMHCYAYPWVSEREQIRVIPRTRKCGVCSAVSHM